MNWRQMGAAAFVTAIVVAVIVSKEDVDRYLKMRRM
jgi:hypothetical protein